MSVWGSGFESWMLGLELRLKGFGAHARTLNPKPLKVSGLGVSGFAFLRLRTWDSRFRNSDKPDDVSVRSRWTLGMSSLQPG